MDAVDYAVEMYTELLLAVRSEARAAGYISDLYTTSASVAHQHSLQHIAIADYWLRRLTGTLA